MLPVDDLRNTMPFHFLTDEKEEASPGLSLDRPLTDRPEQHVRIIASRGIAGRANGDPKPRALSRFEAEGIGTKFDPRGSLSPFLERQGVAIEVKSQGNHTSHQFHRLIPTVCNFHHSGPKGSGPEFELQGSGIDPQPGQILLVYY